MTGERIRSELARLMVPLKAVSWKVPVYGSVALALMLIYLHQGQRGFFLQHFAPWVFMNTLGPELEWWATLYQFAAAFVLLFLVPMVLLKLVAGEKLGELGLGLGNWKLGLLVVLLGWGLVALPGGIGAGSMADFRAEYPLAKLSTANTSRFLVYQLVYGLLYYLAWESFFRGFLQLGLRAHLGDMGAMLLQTSASTLLHIGKPQVEIWAALVAGFVLGLVVLRTRSVWPLVLIHWGLGLVTDLSCAHASGSWP